MATTQQFLTTQWGHLILTLINIKGSEQNSNEKLSHWGYNTKPSDSLWTRRLKFRWSTGSCFLINRVWFVCNHLFIFLLLQLFLKRWNRSSWRERSVMDVALAPKTWTLQKPGTQRTRHHLALRWQTRPHSASAGPNWHARRLWRVSRSEVKDCSSPSAMITIWWSEFIVSTGRGQRFTALFTWNKPEFLDWIQNSNLRRVRIWNSDKRHSSSVCTS